MTKYKWISISKRHFMKVAKMNHRDSKIYAEIIYESFYEDFEDDPRGAANEEMDCWSE